MLQAIRRFLGLNSGESTGLPRRSPARTLMEAAQSRAATDARAAHELRKAAVAQLSVMR